MHEKKRKDNQDDASQIAMLTGVSGVGKHRRLKRRYAHSLQINSDRKRNQG